MAYMDESKNSYEQPVFNINQVGESFSGLIHVAPMFYRFIIGKKWSTKIRIEKETNTIITIPKSKDISLYVHVEGSNFDSVSSSLKKIADIVHYGRCCVPLTHFFSIPTNDESMKENFEMFKNKISLNYREDLFQKSHKLHLTLSTIVLGDQIEIDEALDKVNRIFMVENGHLLENPIKILIKGLGFFGKDVKHVRVLFGKVANGFDRDRLEELANKLQDFLVKQNIIFSKEMDNISFHITLMNSSFIKYKNEHVPFRNFDCSNFFDEYVNWEFGVICVENFFLSEMHSADSSNYYKNVGSFAFGRGNS